MDFRYIVFLVKRNGDKEHIKCASQLVFLDYFSRLLAADCSMISRLKMPVTVDDKEYTSGLEALQTFGYDVYSLAMVMKECNMDFSTALEKLQEENLKGTEDGYMDSCDRLDFMLRHKSDK